MRAASPAWIASSSASRSKRETSVTASRIASSVTSPVGQQQRQLLDLLLRGEQVALDAVGEPLERLHRGALLLAREALGEPVGQLVAGDGLRLDHHAGAVERVEPLRSSSAASRARAAAPASRRRRAGARSRPRSRGRPRCRACRWGCAARPGGARRRATGWRRRRRSGSSRRPARRRTSRARCSRRGARPRGCGPRPRARAAPRRRARRRAGPRPSSGVASSWRVEIFTDHMSRRAIATWRRMRSAISTCMSLNSSCSSASLAIGAVSL